MRSVLVSKPPRIVANVLNEKASILTFKKFPKDYKGWVYIYCTKDRKHLVEIQDYQEWGLNKYEIFEDLDYDDRECACDCLNGEVVARFYCDKVSYSSLMWEKRTILKDGVPESVYIEKDELIEKSCLTKEELLDYECCNYRYGVFAIHISKLEIFDEPKELSEFKHYKKPNCDSCPFQHSADCDYHVEVECDDIPLTKAPSNYCYVEVE